PRRAASMSASEPEIFGFRPFRALRIVALSPLRLFDAAFSIRLWRRADPPAFWAAASLERTASVFACSTFASDGDRSPAAAPPTAPSTAVSWRLTPANPLESVKTQPTFG